MKKVEIYVQFYGSYVVEVEDDDQDLMFEAAHHKVVDKIEDPAVQKVLNSVIPNMSYDFADYEEVK